MRPPEHELEPISHAAMQVAQVLDRVAQDEMGRKSLQAQVRTVFLEHGRAESVAPIVETLLASEELPAQLRFQLARQGRPAPDAGPAVRVVADRRLNALRNRQPARPELRQSLHHVRLPRSRPRPSRRRAR